MTIVPVFACHVSATNVSLLQEKLREAAKARLRRMMKEHKKKTGLNVPDWVKEQWRTQDQNSMAQILINANWSKDTSNRRFVYAYPCMCTEGASQNACDGLWLFGAAAS